LQKGVRNMSFPRRVIQVSVLLAVALIFQSSPSQAESPAAPLLAVGPLVYDVHLIDDDDTGNSVGNGNGIIDAGETTELYVDLRNIGADAATGVNVCLAEDSPYVNGVLFNDCSNYSDIPGGGGATNLNDWEFEVDPATPHGHVINLALTITAANGGPWVDTFSVTVSNYLSQVRVGLISDGTELAAITPILDELGMTYDLLNNNWDGSQGIYTSDPSLLSEYGVVVWYGSGGGIGRLTTQSERDTLEEYVQSGGRLLVTGYDTLGSPADNLLADLVRSSSVGDSPFTYDYTVTDGAHPIMNGIFGQFPNGTALVAGNPDHDQAEASTVRGAVTVAELTGGRDKIVATDLNSADASSGRVVYWNGNLELRDWVGQPGTSMATVDEEKEGFRGLLSNERLKEGAVRLNPDQIPPEANYGGGGPALGLSDAALERLASDIIILGSETTTFSASGDTFNVQADPFWYNDGDYAEGVRTFSQLGSVEHVDYFLVIGENFLAGAGQVDLSLSINGIEVGSFSVSPGELVKSVSFDFVPIAGPTYTIRLEETNTVGPGLGSITLPIDLSTLSLSSRQPEIFKNTMAWLADGAEVGGQDVYLPFIVKKH
jgi:hypothetical protein